MRYIYFIRHAEATHNADFESLGLRAYYLERNRDSELTSKGELQASAVTAPDVDIVFVSPLTRTLNTARIIFEKAPVRMVVTDIVRECNYNHICNNRKQCSDLEHKYLGMDFSNLCEDDQIFDCGSDLVDRNKQLDELIDNHCDKNIAIVSHCSFLNGYFKYKGYGNIELDNCQIYKVER